MHETLVLVVEQAKEVLEMTPPDVVGHHQYGIVLTGGGALISGIEKLFSSELKVPVFAAEKPLDAVALGTGILLNNIDQKNRPSSGLFGILARLIQKTKIKKEKIGVCCEI